MTNVADIPLDGKKDAIGQDIRCFYGRKPPRYAVYRVDRRVMIHFADDGEEEARQRKELAQLAPVRGEIDGLVDGWRDGTSHRFLGVDNRAKLRSKAIRYDRRVADALLVALEGDAATAQTLLAKVKEDIVNERVAWARFEYLVAAFASALIVMFVAWLLSALYPVVGRTDTGDRMAAVGIVILTLMLLTGFLVHLAGVRSKPRHHPHGRAGKDKRDPAAHPNGEEDEQNEAPLQHSQASNGKPATPAAGAREEAEEDGGTGLQRLLPGFLLFAILAVPVFAILISPSFTYAPIESRFSDAIDLWRAAASGAVGAFFSISLAIRGRTVLPDLQRTSNLMDAVLRVTIGFIAGAVVMALTKAEVVNLTFGEARASGEVLPVLITGFIAGFSERLVPDLLDKADFKTNDPSAPRAVVPPVSAPAHVDGAAGTRAGAGSATGRGGAAVQTAAESQTPADEPDPLPEETAEDSCAAAIDLEDDEVTPDSDLPAATGGVEGPAEGGAR